MAIRFGTHFAYIESGLTIQTKQSGFYNDHDSEGYAVGDFDNDGVTDIALAPSMIKEPPAGAFPEFPVEIYLRRGDQFALATSALFKGPIPTTGWANYPALVEDFNGDGRTDWMVLDHGREANFRPDAGWPGRALSLFLSNSAGGLIDASATHLPPSRAFNHSGSAGDIDGDGDIDVLVSRLGPRDAEPRTRVTLFLNDGSGRFTIGDNRLPAEITAIPSPNVNYGTNRLADVNADGRTDIVVAGYNQYNGLPSEDNVYLQRGDGSFFLWQTIDRPASFNADVSLGASQIEALDFSGDGRTDLIIKYEPNVSGTSNRIRLLVQQADGKFIDETVQRIGGYDVSAQFGYLDNVNIIDINSDGHPDLFMKSFSFSSSIDVLHKKIWLNDGTGHFAQMSYNPFPKVEGFVHGSIVPTGNADFFTLNMTQALRDGGGPATVALLRPTQPLSSGPGGSDPALMGAAGFNEQFYLNSYADVRAAVTVGQFSSGLAHYLAAGRAEGRQAFAANSHIRGADGSDVILLREGAETVFALNGDDAIRTGRGDDVVDGGGGFDTVFFDGKSSGYTVTRQGAVLIVSGKDGVDQLVNVEQLRFDDATVDAARTNDFKAIDAKSFAAPAVAMTAFVTGKAPTQSELAARSDFSEKQYAYYAHTLGVAAPQLGPYEALGLAFSKTAAFEAKYSAGESKDAFVAHAYRDAFQRDPTGAQSTALVQQIDYFSGLYRGVGIEAAIAQSQARGAVLGQIVGYMMEESGSPFRAKVDVFLAGVAAGDAPYGALWL